MDEYVDDFVSVLPQEKREKLDYSPESLDVVERWLLKRYPSNQARKEALRNEQEDKQLYMGAMCYVGETFRKNWGGIWNVHLNEPDYLYGILPVIEQKSGGVLCPAYLMSRAIDTRAGELLKILLEGFMKPQQPGAI